MTELRACLSCWARLLFVVTVCFAQNERSPVEVSPSNPCFDYARCINPAYIPTTRVITAMFSFNFNRFAENNFLQDICYELNEVSFCGNLLRRCRREGWPQAIHFQNSDVELAQWVCLNKWRFEAHNECWDDPFLSEMSSCTGLVQLLQPTECLRNKIQNLDNCSAEAKILFDELLSAAHSS